MAAAVVGTVDDGEFLSHFVVAGVVHDVFGIGEDSDDPDRLDVDTGFFLGLPDSGGGERLSWVVGRLCSIGRAPGCFVSGFLQDPRKETIKARHLFTQTIALRLREREEVAMVLGDGAIAAGAACHKISRGSPGVGYALDETGRLVRVRAGFVSDQTIRQAAAAFPAVRHDPIVVSDPNDEPAAKPRTRRPRTVRPVGEDAA